MTEYITASQIQNRLTPIGYQWVADRDASGTGVTSAEESLYVTPAIQYAGSLVDEAVSSFMESTEARNQGNQWLQDRCLDIAVARAVELGGRKVPKHLELARQDAMERLEKVREQDLKVPGLTYSPPGIGSGRSPLKMRAYNVK